MHSPVSLSSVCVVLLSVFTLLRTEILLSHSQVVTGNVSSILRTVWMFRNIILLDPFSAAMSEVGGTDSDFQTV